jgi:SAM-dependent methyltransferase
MLRQAGHSVVGADLDVAKLAGVGLRAVALDLNRELPFRPDSFDAVVSLEGLEHLESPLVPLQEFHRVLRLGGALVLSTPNILNLRSRAKFLLTGSLYWFDEAGYRRGGHVNALPLPELRYLLMEVGFTVERVGVNRRTPGLGAIAALVGPALRAVARLRRAGIRSNTRDVLAGEVLIVRARKGRTVRIPAAERFSGWPCV